MMTPLLAVKRSLISATMAFLSIVGIVSPPSLRTRPPVASDAHASDESGPRHAGESSGRIRRGLHRFRRRPRLRAVSGFRTHPPRRAELCTSSLRPGPFRAPAVFGSGRVTCFQWCNGGHYDPPGAFAQARYCSVRSRVLVVSTGIPGPIVVVMVMDFR